MGIVCSGLAYVLWAEALKKAERTVTVSNMLFLEPAITSVLGYIFLKEVPSAGTVIGGILILAGLWYFSENET